MNRGMFSEEMISHLRFIKKIGSNLDIQAEGTVSIKTLEVRAYLMSCGNSKEDMSAELSEQE